MSGGPIIVKPLEGLLFDHTKIVLPSAEIDSVESDTYEGLEKTNKLYFYCIELGNVLVFYHKGTLGSDNLLELPISDIISAQIGNKKKRIGKKWFLEIKTSKEGIKIYSSEENVHAFKEILDGQLEKQKLIDKTKKIILTSDGSTKTLTIHPFSPAVQDGEESIFSITKGELGFLVTNYRILEDYFSGGGKSKSLTHADYEDVIASNVEKRREEDIVGGVEETPSMWNAFSGYTGVSLSHNKSTHHSSSTESEFGDIVFMNNGKQVLIWRNFPDPNSIVKLINSAKAHFKTAPAASPSSEEEDPIKALKLRFAKGEITKKQFLEMKKILE